MNDMDLLAEGLAEHGRSLSERQRDQFAIYKSILQDWSSRMNLTAIRDADGIVVRHFLDSLTCATATGDLNGQQVIDVGTGAGFPGLPLKILFPEMSLTLTDSVAKKTTFLQAVVDALQLRGVSILARRAEDLGQDPIHRERYDWAVARSVAELRVLAEYLLPLARVGGHVLAQKGEHYGAEVMAAADAIALLGGTIASTQLIQLPQVATPHALIVIEKRTPTPDNYPRRAGVPSKRPL
jgi:16S rRNA (guanine527-N7)-methyltransferase